MNLAQKILLLILYGLIILMVVFSIIAIKDKNYQGYKRCIDEKCKIKNEQFCSKYREINNCCLGAGGKIVQVSDGFDCIFA